MVQARVTLSDLIDAIDCDATPRRAWRRCGGAPAAGPQAVHALMTAQASAPIVFAIVGDPIGDGIVDSLARPGRNVTGLSMSNTDLESKRVEVLKDAVPSLSYVRDGVQNGGLQ
jgi:hypothetical protein